MNLSDEEMAKFVTGTWLKQVGDVPIDEVAVMVCEDPSVVTALVGALRHARKQLDADHRRDDTTRRALRASVSSWLCALSLRLLRWSLIAGGRSAQRRHIDRRMVHRRHQLEARRPNHLSPAESRWSDTDPIMTTSAPRSSDTRVPTCCSGEVHSMSEDLVLNRGLNKSKCRSCKKEVTWAYTTGGKKAPFEADEKGEWVLENGTARHVGPVPSQLELGAPAPCAALHESLRDVPAGRRVEAAAMKSGTRLNQLPIGVLRRMAREPMTPFEAQDVSDIPGRCTLVSNERWSPIAYVNNRYTVQISTVATAIGEVMHLWIRHHAGEMPRAWSDLQRIKNEIAGNERAAVEVFPPASELVDSANMAHLWVFPEDYVIPFQVAAMTIMPEWFVPLDDGSAPPKIEIRERVVPPCVLLNLIESKRLLTPVEATQLGMALCEAAKHAAQLGQKKRTGR
jgi:hypothetical protein